MKLIKTHRRLSLFLFIVLLLSLGLLYRQVKFNRQAKNRVLTINYHDSRKVHVNLSQVLEDQGLALAYPPGSSYENKPGLKEVPEATLHYQVYLKKSLLDQVFKESAKNQSLYVSLDPSGTFGQDFSLDFSIDKSPQFVYEQGGPAHVFIRLKLVPILKQPGPIKEKSPQHTLDIFFQTAS